MLSTTPENAKFSISTNKRFDSMPIFLFLQFIIVTKQRDSLKNMNKSVNNFALLNIGSDKYFSSIRDGNEKKNQIVRSRLFDILSDLFSRVIADTNN
ncbi:hypothetical protein BpHYR1_042204 [Brachionus plicatilis]|uniref:Uncharacterized protein n=1 Tax=Brachionus plicatilis TaxID=10195 RepID=A0A3M7SGL4_BRAPC|nr:hypothetical protein BpHYR1_042204 [Brachionus plicatilis]